MLIEIQERTEATTAGGKPGNFYLISTGIYTTFLPRNYCNGTAMTQVKSRKMLKAIELKEHLDLKASGFNHQLKRG